MSFPQISTHRHVPSDKLSEHEHYYFVKDCNTLFHGRTEKVNEAYVEMSGVREIGSRSRSISRSNMLCQNQGNRIHLFENTVFHTQVHVREHTQNICCAINPFNSVVAIGTSENTVLLMHSVIGDLICELNVLNREEEILMLCVDFSIGGKYLVSGSSDSYGYIWNVDTKALLSRINFHGGIVCDVAATINVVAFSCGPHPACGARIVLWSIENNVEIAVTPLNKYLPLVFMPTNDHCLPLLTEHFHHSILYPISTALHCTCDALKVRFLISVMNINANRSAIALWGFAEDTPFLKNLCRVERIITMIECHPREDVVLVCGTDGLVEICSIPGLVLIETIRHPGNIHYAKFSSDGQYIVAYGYANEGKILVFNFASRQIVREYCCEGYEEELDYDGYEEETDRLVSAEFSQDDSIVVVCTRRKVFEFPFAQQVTFCSDEFRTEFALDAISPLICFPDTVKYLICEFISGPSFTL